MEQDDRYATKEEMKLVRDRTHALSNSDLVLTAGIERLKDDVKEAEDEIQLAITAQHSHDIVLERIEAEMRSLGLRLPLTLSADIATVTLQLRTLSIELESVKLLIKSEFVRQSEFDPVRKIVYGVVGVILLAVITALVALVLNK